MPLLQLIRMCFKNVTLNKFRSFLTMLGIVIGVSSVIILSGLTQGSNKDISTSLKSLGADVVEVAIYSSSDEKLEYNDLKEINSSFAKDMVAVSKARSTIRYGSSTASFQVLGTKPNYLNIQQISLKSGRNISDLDVENASNVAVIGSDAAKQLFGIQNPINQKIIINSTYYAVVGVLEQGNSSTSSTNSSIIVPITSNAKSSKSESITNIYFVAQSDANTALKAMENSIERELGKIISTDNIEIVTQDASSTTIDQVSSTMKVMIAVVGLIALVVSGIGVMNIMLVSVSERTREIGVRKAIGATNLSILGQFLFEAVVLTSLGGVLGLGCSILVKEILQTMNITFVLDMNAVNLALMFSALVGIVFGIVPALRAAQLKPVDALKYE